MYSCRTLHAAQHFLALLLSIPPSPTAAIQTSTRTAVEIARASAAAGSHRSSLRPLLPSQPSAASAAEWSRSPDSPPRRRYWPRSTPVSESTLSVSAAELSRSSRRVVSQHARTRERVAEPQSYHAAAGGRRIERLALGAQSALTSRRTGCDEPPGASSTARRTLLRLQASESIFSSNYSCPSVHVLRAGLRTSTYVCSGKHRFQLYTWFVVECSLRCGSEQATRGRSPSRCRRRASMYELRSITRQYASKFSMRSSIIGATARLELLACPFGGEEQLGRGAGQTGVGNVSSSF